MGNRLSRITSRGSPEPLSTSSFIGAEVDDYQDDDAVDYQRAKRRKLNDGRKTTSSSNAGVRDRASGVANSRNETTRARATSQAQSSKSGLAPSDFYGKNSSNSRGSVAGSAPSSTAAIATLLPARPKNFQPALKIDLLSINTAPDEIDEFGQCLTLDASVEISCICTVALWARINEKGHPNKHAHTLSEELCKKAQPCKISITKHIDGTISRDLMISPFIFKPADFCVLTRRSRPRNSRVDLAPDLAQKYFVRVNIKNDGHGRNWPPIAIPPDSGSKDPTTRLSTTPISSAVKEFPDLKREVYMGCMIDIMQESIDARLTLRYGRYDDDNGQKINYFLKTDSRWSVPPTHAARTKAPQDSIASSLEAMALDAIEEARPVTPIPIEETAAEVVGSRSRRPRKDVVYNPRKVFAAQLGKSPQALTEQEFGDTKDEIKVTYILGKAGVADINVKQRYEFRGLGCHLCESKTCETFDDLRFHLMTNHCNFKFTLRNGKAPHYRFLIELNISTPGKRVTYQLNQSSTLFDLEKYLDGDKSWLQNRYGPQQNLWPAHLSQRMHDSSTSPSPLESRRSSPNTSCDPKDVDYQKLLGARSQADVRPRYFVPRTKKPLYDTITKELLQPGDDLPDSDDEIDEHWLTLKHRDTVLDYTDVSPHEKEYFNKWNPFITAERLTCPAYLHVSILKFAEQERDWLLDPRWRLTEFCKHMEVFIMLGHVTERDRAKIFDIFFKELKRREKGKGKAMEDVGMEDVPPEPKKRDFNYCECGYLPLGPKVVCTQKGCPAPLYHKKCAIAQGRSINRQNMKFWKCTDCLRKETFATGSIPEEPALNSEVGLKHQRRETHPTKGTPAKYFTPEDALFHSEVELQYQRSTKAPENLGTRLTIEVRTIHEPESVLTFETTPNAPMSDIMDAWGKQHSVRGTEPNIRFYLRDPGLPSAGHRKGKTLIRPKDTVAKLGLNDGDQIFTSFLDATGKHAVQVGGKSRTML